MPNSELSVYGEWNASTMALASEVPSPSCQILGENLDFSQNYLLKLFSQIIYSRYSYESKKVEDFSLRLSPKPKSVADSRLAVVGSRIHFSLFHFSLSSYFLGSLPIPL